MTIPFDPESGEAKFPDQPYDDGLNRFLVKLGWTTSRHRDTNYADSWTFCPEDYYYRDVDGRIVEPSTIESQGNGRFAVMRSNLIQEWPLVFFSRDEVVKWIGCIQEPDEFDESYFLDDDE